MPTSASASASATASKTSPFSKASDIVGDAFEAVEDRFEDALGQYSALAGKLFPILSKLYISPAKATKIFKAIQKVQDPCDWIFIFLLGWVTIPLVRIPYEKIVIGTTSQRRRKKSADTGTGTGIIPAPARPFNDTFIFHFAEHLAQAGKIAALVYGLDCLAIALDTLGFQAATTFSPYIAKAIYTMWMFKRFSRVVHYLVFKSFGVVSSKDKEDPEKRGSLARAQIVNRLFEMLCLAGCFFAMVDVLKVKSGASLKSLFAVSGAGTAVLAVASRDIASSVVNGLALQASDKVYEGEKIMFGNGIKGTVEKIGLFETLIRDSTEMLTAVPNTELSNQKITNISRNRYSQVKQKLHFQYEDLDKLPALMHEIKKEICKSCPLVVSDGTKPFRAYFSAVSVVLAGVTELSCTVKNQSSG